MSGGLWWDMAAVAGMVCAVSIAALLTLTPGQVGVRLHQLVAYLALAGLVLHIGWYLIMDQVSLTYLTWSAPTYMIIAWPIWR